MKANVKKIGIGVIVFAIGYAAGLIIGIPETHGNGAGDISKVNKYHSSVVSPQVSAYQEMIMNDSTALQQANVSLAVLTSRMVEFSKLVDIAADATQGKDEFNTEISDLKSIQRLSENAAQSGQAAGQAFASVAAGNKDALAGSYEQTSQNFTVAYLMVDRQISAAKEFVAAADSYLEKNGVENNKDLALARDLWAHYCAGEAVLNGDKAELAYWSKKESALKGEELAAAYEAAADSTLKLAVALDHMCGLNDIKADDAFKQVSGNFLGATQVVVLSQGKVILSKDQTVMGKDQTILSKDQTVMGKDQTVFGKGVVILSKNDVILSKDQTVMGKDQTVMGKDQTVMGKDQTIMGKDQTILSKDQTVMGKDNVILSKDDAIKSLSPMVQSSGDATPIPDDRRRKGF